MKAILKFDLPEEDEFFRNAVNGTDWKDKFEEVWEQLFRPLFKHGYSDPVISEFLKKHPEADDLIERMADIYQRIKDGR